MPRRIEVTAGFCICWAALLLLLPLRLILAAAAAAIFHESCHAAAIRLSGGEILGLTIGAGGMVMETTPMTAAGELVCALAGPGGSFLLTLLGRWFPTLGLCAFAQGCFNLLPFYPMDGGRALACGLRMLFPSKWRQAAGAVEWAVLLLLLPPALRLGVGGLAVWGMLAARKIPCKATRFAVE